MGKNIPPDKNADFRMIFDAISDAIFIIDSSGQILNANLTATLRYGYSADELMQMNVSDLAAPHLGAEILPRLHKALDSPEQFEWIHRCKNGNELQVEIYSSPIIYLGKRAILSSVRDISQRKKLESRLQDKTHMLERILETEPGTVYIFDLPEQQNVYVNRHWLTAFGYTHEEAQAMGSEVLQLFHPDDLPTISANHAAWKDASNEEIRSIEYRIRDKQGVWHWLNSRETPFTRDAQGQVSQILGIAHDITRRKHMETLLDGQKHILEMIATGIPLPDTLTALVRLIEAQSPGMLGSILLLDEDGIHVRHGAAPSLPAEFVAAVDGQPIGPCAGSCGTAAYRKEAVFVEEIATDPLWAVYKAAALPHALHACWSTPIFDKQQRVLGTFAMYYRQPGLPQAEQLRLIDTATHTAAIAIIHHRTETALKAGKERLRKLIDGIGSETFLGLLTTDGTLIEANRLALAAGGLEPADVLGKPFEHTYWWSYSEPVQQQLRAAIERAALGESSRYDVQVRAAENQFIIIDFSLNPLRDETGKVEFLVPSANVITERKRAEIALQESEARYRLLFEYAPSGIVIANPESYYLDANESMCRMLGYTRDELIGLRASDIVFQAEIQHIEPALQAIKTENHYLREWRLRRKDGSTFAAEVTATTMPDGNLLGIIRDITERKLAEAQVLRLTQLYAALSQCNQAIVRCASEAELLPQVCRDAVVFGGMKMAWIGMLDEASKLIKPVASFGVGIEFLEGIEVSVDANKPSGQGPTGTAMRGNQPYWCQDFHQDPATAVWREGGMKFGWNAMASLPLHRHGVTVGAFILYSDTVNAFDKAAQDLLVEMAMDIGFALNRFDNETERKREQDQLRKLSQTVEQSPNVILITDLDARIEYVNTAFVKTTGYSPDEVIGKNPRLLKSGKTPRTTYDSMWDCLNRGESWQGELFNKRKDGIEYIESVYISPMREDSGQITHYLGIKEDITERKYAEERIQYLANFDVLTGLPNRIQLAEHLKYALSLAKRSNGYLALMFIDLDRFKDINDTLGHSIGDAFLIEAARRLQSVLREEDTASRMGGDEFILMLPGCDAVGASQVAQKLLDVIAEPYLINLYDLVVTASIGIALYPYDGVDLETLSKSADTAMYRAKQDGRNGYCFFTAEMQARTTRNLQLINALRHALERDQLQIYYQPQVSMRDPHITGAEALLRWQHPEFGMISPEEFIPAAEDSGLILPIGEWVLRTAVQQLKQWIDNGHEPMIISVNLSAVQFRHPSLPDLVTNILNEAQLPAQYLELELTEGVAMQDPPGAIAMMNKLHERGIRMSIDDFGTGYSSLSYLKKFKVYKLKIDQSFVRDISTDLEDKAIVAAIISMAKSLGLQTIAEGVETAEQLEFLSAQGCDEVQGYFYSKPLSATQFEAFAENAKLALIKL
ncbi:PAS domain S-box protein [Sulfuriferula sp. GW1]|uniref:PAS domain S-box protein n=1 Tax=Sulfuriferula sp. GW1 TaxID=3345111 RepID=UPI0039B040F8